MYTKGNKIYSSLKWVAGRLAPPVIRCVSEAVVREMTVSMAQLGLSCGPQGVRGSGFTPCAASGGRSACPGEMRLVCAVRSIAGECEMRRRGPQCGYRAGLAPRPGSRQRHQACAAE
ncbi:uncharacterized protein LOC124795323 [Schistocerca piceifrons]|uniref:uncharacterized protein LOC124795323 n=1 Tax=Schistocerca piceifrons TaxID=274613 RepID=UPI001F5E905F|nr:uncharacterized protein LOC124795323 [Schistocerca piceifrons]